jgi:hypothetical protein
VARAGVESDVVLRGQLTDWRDAIPVAQATLFDGAAEVFEQLPPGCHGGVP